MRLGRGMWLVRRVFCEYVTDDSTVTIEGIMRIGYDRLECIFLVHQLSDDRTLTKSKTRAHNLL